MYLSCEGHKVVLAQAVDLNVLYNNHFIVSLVKEHIVDEFFDVHVVAFGQEQQRLRIPQRGGLQTLAVWILAHALK